jgi:hypothetical protein
LKLDLSEVILTAEGAEGFGKGRRGKLLSVLCENLSVLCG